MEKQAVGTTWNAIQVVPDHDPGQGVGRHRGQSAPAI